MATRTPFGKRGRPQVKQEFARQFHGKSSIIAREKTATRNKSVKIRPPKYVPIGSGVARTHILQQRKQRYYGEGIF